MPDPTILSSETGTATARPSARLKQTDALVIAVSQRREVVSLYVGRRQVHPRGHPGGAREGQPGARDARQVPQRLDQVSTRLTALEFEGDATLHDVLTVLQRAELVTRMAAEIERYIVELGTEGRLIEMQLEEMIVGAAADKAALVRRLPRRRSEPTAFAASAGAARLASRTRIFSTSGGSPSCSATTASSTHSTTRSRRAATGCSGASHGCRSWLSQQHRRGQFGGLEEMLAAPDA